MTGFITFHGTVMNVSEILYAVVEEVKKKYELKVMMRGGFTLTWTYEAEDEAEKALEEIRNLITLPDGSVIISTPSDGTALPMTTTSGMASKTETT